MKIWQIVVPGLLGLALAGSPIRATREGGLKNAGGREAAAIYPLREGLMKIWQIVVPGLLGLALAGCRSDPAVALLERDNLKKSGKSTGCGIASKTWKRP